MPIQEFPTVSVRRAVRRLPEEQRPCRDKEEMESVALSLLMGAPVRHCAPTYDIIAMFVRPTSLVASPWQVGPE